MHHNITFIDILKLNLNLNPRSNHLYKRFN